MVVVQASSTTIRLTYNIEPNPPFNMGNHLTEKPGITIEVIRAAGHRLTLNFVFVKMPWKRCLYTVQKNTMDGTIDASFKKERMKVGVYPMADGEIDASKRNNTQSYSIFTTQASDIESIEDLFNKYIGVTRGYSIITDLESKGIKNIIETNGSLVSLRMLKRKRIHAVVDLEANIQSQLHSYPNEFQDIRMITPPVKSKNYYLLFSHKFYRENKTLAHKIWNEIASIRESKQYQQLFDKY
ncbi:transporter substrate-binding domain-containing protein [Endozoicomonas sp. SM1973]|uniref:Transporter substrate-binding domain-containing protein n=1 Tax=Spartinivicinus marinus TaxID=2994442 RepID=A0A853I1Y4_9GAMM|nr:transporter substrate-binding domain-containing protein [Spartinivicinus marinus]MCX4028473.1 transporter substrate-binding domain-containing protein [Spartinivicinus marinus]NYZ67413.1 transporter substrate-binding domain-containing protein [Spartinivicinus marinus]